jgi:ADP-heptose:LPS heptosyltransferase
MIKVFSRLRTLFHNGWSYAKIRSNQGYVGKVRAPARARSRARKLGYARGSMEKIAIIRRNGLGDLLCAYPLILYLQKERQAEITLFVDLHNASLIPYLPPVAQVVVFPKSGNKYWNMWRVARPFRKRFDVAICAKTSPMKLMNYFLFCLGAKKRIAYLGRGWHRIFVNCGILYDHGVAQTRHQACNGLRTVNPRLEKVPATLYPTLHIPPKIRAAYHVNWNPLHPVVLISATTTHVSNRFDPLRYATLLNRLYRQWPLSVLIIGQPQDRVRASAIAAGLQMEHRVHFPRNFDEFMVWLDVGDVFFVGEGGVGHIGAALGKPAVVLFGGIDPIRWAPLSEKVKILYHPTHVDHLDDESIFHTLKGVIRDGRDNL